jgi:serine/threonine protein kinase
MPSILTEQKKSGVLFHDLCRIYKSFVFTTNNFIDLYVAFFPQIDFSSGTTSFFESKLSLVMCAASIGKGAFGEIMSAKYDSKDIALKLQIATTDKKSWDVCLEFIVHISLYCVTRNSTSKTLSALGINSARIPKPVVSFRDGNKFYYGLEKLEMSLGQLYTNPIFKNETTTRREIFLTGILCQISRRLIILQKTTSFLHGDFHAENIMLKKTKKGDKTHYTAYIIDFGYSKVIVNNVSLTSSYQKESSDKSLDLLTLVTSLHYELPRARSGVLHEIIDPFWNLVELGIFWKNPKFTEKQQMSYKRVFFKNLLKPKYKHHSLYWNACGVEYAPCVPENMLNFCLNRLRKLEVREYDASCL